MDWQSEDMATSSVGRELRAEWVQLQHQRGALDAMAAEGTIPGHEKLLYHLKAASDYGSEALWEFASRELDEAELVCDDPTLGNDEKSQYRRQVLVQRSALMRRQANYPQAVNLLKQAIKDYGNGDLDHSGILGELGVAYIRQAMFDEAQSSFEEQYTMSKRLAEVARASSDEVVRAWRAEGLICRAVGYLGNTAYSLAVPDFDDTSTVNREILDLSIKYNTERVDRATILLKEIENADQRLIKEIAANTRHCVALDRLVLCYCVLGDHAKALECARESVQVSKMYDPTLQALGRFYYGVALLCNGQHKDAVEQWEAVGDNNLCTSAIAICKEPSQENISFLKQLVSNGVQIDNHDEQGYSALDYAVMGKNAEMEQVVIEGLRNGLLKAGVPTQASEKLIAMRKIEAHRRREYRSIFQVSFRPFLRANALRDHNMLSTDEKMFYQARMCIRQLRQQYLKSLTTDESARNTFDSFKYILLDDFQTKMGKLPRPDNAEDMRTLSGLVRTYDGHIEQEEPYVVFFSYRWLVRGAPDDEWNTQYHRMTRAMDLYLEHHKWLARDKVGIWLDVGCIDQADPKGKQRGINSLPLSIAQCNAMISLVDPNYLERAWCSVELQIMQTLRDSYHLHEHWDYSFGDLKEEAPPNLKRGTTAMPIDDKLTGLKLSFPDEDAPTVKFLVRQSRILAKV